MVISKIRYVVLKLETIHNLATNTNQCNVYIVMAKQSKRIKRCIFKLRILYGRLSLTRETGLLYKHVIHSSNICKRCLVVRMTAFLKLNVTV